MADLNSLSLALLKEKGLHLQIERCPSEIWQELITAVDEHENVRSTGPKFTCPFCKSRLRVGAFYCSRCAGRAIPNLEDKKSLIVKLVSNGVSVHGLASALVASWNPCRLVISIYKHGLGSRLQVQLIGCLSKIELAVFTALYSLMAWAVYVLSASIGDWLHQGLAVFIFVAGPFAHVSLRANQEEQLFDFLKNHVLGN